MGSRSLLGWLAAPQSGRVLHFADPEGAWTTVEREELAHRVRQAAWRLRDAGVATGDTVLVTALPTPDFVAYFFGTLLAGATPVAAPAPRTFSAHAEYLGRIRDLLALSGARVVTAPGELAASLARADAAGVVLGPVEARWPALDLPDAAPPARTALLQLSSGTSGPQQAVHVSTGALEANLRAMSDWVGQAGSMAAWLPMSHNMGLVGTLLTTLVNGWEGWFMRPESFVRRPAAWLECFGRFGADISGAPTFGLAHLLRRVHAEDLKGYDFSGWRTLILAGERVDPDVLSAFQALLEPHGFDRNALLPAYGMTEATLVVSGRRHADPLRSLPLDPASLGIGKRVRPAPAGSAGVGLVSCGRPLVGTEITVVGEDGTPLEPGRLGEIVVRSPSLADGRQGDGGRHTSFDGRLHTGDAGFLHDGELFVVGRLGDSLKIRGTWLFAEDLERGTRQVSGPEEPVTVLLGVLGGRESAVVVLREDCDPDLASRTGDTVTKLTAGAVDVVVLAAPAGWVKHTANGKVRRRVTWQQLATGGDGAHPVWSARSRPATPVPGPAT